MKFVSRRRSFRPMLDRLEPRFALAVDTLAIGGQQVASFMDSTGDMVTVSITGSAGTAVFRDAGNSPVADGDNIASVTITGASSDFQLTFGAQNGILPTSIGPRNGVDSVYLGQITADTVIRGINTVTSAAIAPGGGPSTAVSGDISFVLTSFEGVNFSKGGGLFVDVVTGRDSDNLGILLTRGLIPYATIGIRSTLDAVMTLGTTSGSSVDGRLFIGSATADSSLTLAGSNRKEGKNSQLEIVVPGPFDADVTIQGDFNGVANLAGPAGDIWLIQGNVGPKAVLKAAAWQDAPFDPEAVTGTPGVAAVINPAVAVVGNFGGTINATQGAVDMTLNGDVLGSARINAANDVSLGTLGSVRKGAEISSDDDVVVIVDRDFAGKIASRGNVNAGVSGNMQGAIQSGSGDVELSVLGSVLKGSSLVTGGDALVFVDRNFSGSIACDELMFFVDGDVGKSSRITVNRVWDWLNVGGIQIFSVGGQFAGILNAVEFDGAGGDQQVTIVGGGVASGARFNVGYFWDDTLIFEGDFQGNLRTLSNLEARLVFTGDVSRITIAGQVLADITVGGTLMYLNSNSYFQPTGVGKRTGEFWNGLFQPTGSLTTGRYVTVVPVAPSVG